VAGTPAEPAALDGWLDTLLDVVQDVTGPELDDDWTAVAVERRPGEA
jgi:hypothetical protein